MHNTDAPVILSLDADQITLGNAGGKGLNLSRLRRAGLPVPPGFIVTTVAYGVFVSGQKPSADSLSETISDALRAAVTDEPASTLFEGASMGVPFVGVFSRGVSNLTILPTGVVAAGVPPFSVSSGTLFGSSSGLGSRIGDCASCTH